MGFICTQAAPEVEESPQCGYTEVGGAWPRLLHIHDQERILKVDINHVQYEV